MENVLQRVDTEPFYKLLADIMTYSDTHIEIYEELCRRLPEIAPGALSSLLRIKKSLSAIKADLGAQVKAILPEELKEINGLVEIGYPGRYIDGLKQHYKVTGKVVAVYEAQSVTDFIQTGFPRPYDQFVTLDYNKPDLSSLEENSADVITCYVGLHHFPEAELEDFLANVRRVLRDGGHFVIVDHDVVNDKALAMAHMAHTIFNAVTGVSVDGEKSELRNFQPMSYWQELLTRQGLGCGVTGPDVPMIRSGDPSMNRMMSFVKKAPQLNMALSQLLQSEGTEDAADPVEPTMSSRPLFAPKPDSMAVAQIFDDVPEETRAP